MIARPFPIAVPEEELDDLRARLARIRWPREPQAPVWSHGASVDYLRRVAQFWREQYDWRQWEARLNAFGSHAVSLDGERIHFLYEPGSGPRPLPLLLTHGWPGSVAEFLEVIDPLAHPERHGGDVADAFTVVVPSLPGYGWSEPPAQPIPHRAIGRRWHRLMTEVLGFASYVAQAGDVGSAVTSWLALDHPDAVRAIHLNFVSLQPHLDPADPLDEDERAWMAASERRRKGETAYQQIQGTKPVTLAFGLTDSPIGLAAWMLEKFHGWTVPGEQRDPPFDMGHLLTHVMLHWLPGPGPATWTYRFSADGSGRQLGPGERVEVPTGVLLFPQDLSVPPPDRWIRRSYHLVDRVDAERGGHFAAAEQPVLFVREVRRFFRAYR